MNVMRLLASVLLLSAVVATPVGAAKTETYKKIFGDWTVLCREDNGERICSLYTNGLAGAGRNQQPIPVGLSVEAPIGGPPVIALALAGQEFADARVLLAVDEGAPSETRPAAGAAGVALIDGAEGSRLIEAFKAGRRVLVHFTVAATGQQQALFLSLDGFTRAYDSYQAQLFLDYRTPDQFG